MKNLILLKLGGSLITDKEKPYTEKKDIIDDLAVQIKKALEKRPDLSLVIGNGAGSYGHYPTVKYGIKDGIKSAADILGFCEVESGVNRLNRIIVDALVKQGLPALSIDPSSIMQSDKGEITASFLGPLKNALEWGMIPVVYGDIVFDKTQGSAIISTEKQLAHLAHHLRNDYRIEKLIHNGITQGVLDRNGKLIPRITPDSWKDLQNIFVDIKGYDVTGGMLHKVAESVELAKNGFESLIINSSSTKDILMEALIGNEVIGTRITAN